MISDNEFWNLSIAKNFWIFGSQILALRSGSAGFITKHHSLESLLQAIIAIHAGVTWFDRDATTPEPHAALATFRINLNSAIADAASPFWLAKIHQPWKSARNSILQKKTMCNQLYKNRCGEVN